jgi:hypothetical protein
MLFSKHQTVLLRSAAVFAALLAGVSVAFAESDGCRALNARGEQRCMLPNCPDWGVTANFEQDETLSGRVMSSGLDIMYGGGYKWIFTVGGTTAANTGLTVGSNGSAKIQKTGPVNVTSHIVVAQGARYVNQTVIRFQCVGKK